MNYYLKSLFRLGYLWFTEFYITSHPKFSCLVTSSGFKRNQSQAWDTFVNLNRKTTIQYYNITLLTRTCPRIHATFAPEPLEVVPGRISLTPGPCITTTVHTASQAHTQYIRLFLFESSYWKGFFYRKVKLLQTFTQHPMT